MRTSRPSRAMPALLTSTVTGPNDDSTSPNAASTAAASATSALHGQRLAADLLDRGLRLSRAGFVARVAERDRMPGARQLDHDRAADAARPAGDERDPFGGHAPVPHRISALAHVIPAPKPEHSTRSPSRTRPSSTASNSASGIDADDVLP